MFRSALILVQCTKQRLSTPVLSARLPPLLPFPVPSNPASHLVFR